MGGGNKSLCQDMGLRGVYPAAAEQGWGHRSYGRRGGWLGPGRAQAGVEKMWSSVPRGPSVVGSVKRL